MSDVFIEAARTARKGLDKRSRWVVDHTVDYEEITVRMRDGEVIEIRSADVYLVFLRSTLVKMLLL